MGEEIGIVEVPVKWVDLYENTGDEGGFLAQRRKEKRIRTDTEQRKCGEQKGLETPVVHTVNDVHEFEGPEALWNERMH
jgi:hypothetical protein